MGNQQFSNDASSLLAGNLTLIATTVTVATGFGALFPSLTGSQYFMIAVEDTSGNIEIMKCTARSGDNLTVVRAQESTAAATFTANLARVELRDTAGTLAGFVQKAGDTLTGDLNLGTHNVTNGVLGSSISLEGCTEIVNTPLRGLTGATGNQITVPTDGTSRAQAGGVNIVVATDPPPAPAVGVIQLYFGSSANVGTGALTGWHVCDGTTHNGHATPDMRGFFAVGAGGSTPLGTGANPVNVTTTAVSAGTPVLNPVTLVPGNLGAHTHGIGLWTANGAVGFGSDTVAAGSSYAFVGSGSGVRQAAQTGSTGTSTPFTPTATAMGTHAHVVPIPAVGLYYIMYTG